MNKNVTFKIGNQLKKLRKQRYLEDSERYEYCKNQDFFADKMMCTRETVVKWENDRGNPTLKDLKRICDLLNCEPNYLLGVDDVISRIVDDISGVTGLSNIAIERLSDDDFLRQLFNYLLESENATNVIRNIYQIIKAKADAERILDVTYSGMFITRIKNIYLTAMSESIFANDKKGKYAKCLKQELDNDYCEMLSATETHWGVPDDYDMLVRYIKDCMTEQGFSIFSEKYLAYDFETVENYFECFINDVVEQTYDIFMYYQTKDIWMGQIMQEISRKLFDFKYQV